MASPRRLRCAIYTRKSSEEGLEQDFNSLDAQHAACAAFIESQKQEGWRLTPARYDDGGLSGGTLERPALKRLLAEIDSRRIDMVVVYKIDRLTRSLTDFARLVERFEAAACSFVSVTQAFNTSSSMGRLTLNVLLSFAQFERELTTERIRDKLAASKKKGLWMGGLVPLGYEAEGRTLKINDTEAATVRTLYALYLAHRSIPRVKAEADRLGLISKRRLYKDARTQGGLPLTRGRIHHLLTNPVYMGAIRHRQELYPGQHPALIDPQTWEAVQAALQDGAARRRRSQTNGETPRQPAPLAGKLVDETGDRLTPSHAQRGNRRHRYYVSRRLITQPKATRDPAGWRLPAAPLESSIARALQQHLEQQLVKHSLLTTPSPQLCWALQKAAPSLLSTPKADPSETLSRLLEEVRIAPGELRLSLDRNALGQALAIDPALIADQALVTTVPFQLRRRGVEAKVVTGLDTSRADLVLCRTLTKAMTWMEAVRNGVPSAQIAKAEGVSARFIRARLPLALLSPKIVAAIVEGRHPPGLTTERLVRMHIPTDWQEQARRLGFSD